MIIRQFLLAAQDSSAGRRAEAASALARAYLHGGLGPDAAWDAKTAMLALLDDPSPLVRRSLAEACAASVHAPRPLIVALAADAPEIACLVLARSPVLMDADLVDCAAIGCEQARIAIAGRAGLSKSVAAALAEVAGAEALVVLAGNPYAQIGTAACLRMAERHGDDAALREALLGRADIAIEVRQTVAARAAESLAAYSRDSGWISPERGARMMRDARDCATLALGDEVGEAGLGRLIAHLRAKGELNAGLVLRALFSLRMPFVEAALADLGALGRARVAGLMFEPRGAGFSALHRKTGLPPLLLPVFQAALGVWREAASGVGEASGPHLSRRMIERAVSVCEDLPFAESRGLMALLARFEAEAAREEARAIAQALADEAERDEILRIEREERLLLEGPAADVARTDDADPDENRPEETWSDDAWPEAPRAGDRIAPVPGQAQTFPVDAILAELPSAIVASYRAEQDSRHRAAAMSVLDDLSEALAASVRADRETLPRQMPEIVAEPRSARPRSIALRLAAAMRPESGAKSGSDRIAA